MHIWAITDWNKHYNVTDKKHRTGLHLKFDKNVDPEVKRACKDFCKWMRSEYFFPIRVPIYVKSNKRIRASDRDLVYGFFLHVLTKGMSHILALQQVIMKPY